MATPNAELAAIAGRKTMPATPGSATTPVRAVNRSIGNHLPLLTSRTQNPFHQVDCLSGRGTSALHELFGAHPKEACGIVRIQVDVAQRADIEVKVRGAPGQPALA